MLYFLIDSLPVSNEAQGSEGVREKKWIHIAGRNVIGCLSRRCTNPDPKQSKAKGSVSRELGPDKGQKQNQVAWNVGILMMHSIEQGRALSVIHFECLPNSLVLAVQSYS